jgi:hypothetical protein
MGTSRTWLVGLAALAVAGCTVDRTVTNRSLRCDQQQDCPTGFSCVALGGLQVCCQGPGCFANDGGAPPDATAPDASEPDAPTADASVPDAPVISNGPADAPLDVNATPDLPPDAFTCSAQAPCPGFANCTSGGACVPPAANCSDIKGADPGARDGVYWVDEPGRNRVYCDMVERTELCSLSPGVHAGRTRDPSRLRFTLSSVLKEDQGVCELWNLRAAQAPGYPLASFRRTNPADVRDTCAVLGFIKEARLGVCQFGDAPGHSDCGFGTTPLLIWGTLCSCGPPRVGDGEFDHYVLQGPINTGTVLTSATGSATTTCFVH